MGQSIDYIEEPFEVHIVRGVAVLEWPNGARRAIRLDVFREEHRRAGDALDAYDRSLAEVVPFRKEFPAAESG